MKEEQKVSVFHMLGKFLYGKRYNLRYNPNSRVKEEKEISAYYTEEEMKREDPKFYFQPVSLLDRSQMSLSVFSEYYSLIFRMLQQNYVNRFGKVKDIRNMSSIFRYYDSYLSNSLNRY